MPKRRELKGTEMGIEEDLTKSNANLLAKAKKCEKTLFAWSSDGRILGLFPTSGGKPIERLITSENDVKCLNITLALKLSLTL